MYIDINELTGAYEITDSKRECRCEKLGFVLRQIYGLTNLHP